MKEVEVRALHRAAELKGSEEALAKQLGVARSRLRVWMEGRAALPPAVFGKVVDILLEADVAALSAPRILVVDDDQAGAYALARVLKRMGYPVESTTEASKAIELARSFRPEVVFLDLRMPDMDGCELAERLQAEGLAPRVIAATAYGAPEDRQRTYAAGFVAHLLKPIDAASLQGLLPPLTAPIPRPAAR